MIIDTENNHYKVGNNLWFWKWDSIEDWSSIKKGAMLPIWYYGYRVPFLGLFPNIIDVNNTLNSKIDLTSSNALTSALTTAK